MHHGRCVTIAARSIPISSHDSSYYGRAVGGPVGSRLSAKTPDSRRSRSLVKKIAADIPFHCAWSRQQESVTIGRTTGRPSTATTLSRTPPTPKAAAVLNRKGANRSTWGKQVTWNVPLTFRRYHSWRSANPIRTRRSAENGTNHPKRRSTTSIFPLSSVAS